MTLIRFVAGSGRSGTTWIQDALATANGLRPVFEPLHPYLSAVGRRYAHRAVSAHEEHPELEEFLVGVCAGRGPRLWTQYRHQSRWLFPPPERFWSKTDAGRTKRHWAKFLKEFPRMTVAGLRRQVLIKCIRANLMLPWIARHLNSRVVMVVRHPGAVVESEIRNGWHATFALERFSSDETLHEITHNRYRNLLSRKLTQTQALTLRWVIENQWVMEGAAANGIAVFHYEHLRSSTELTWRELCSALSLTAVPDRDTLTRPSQQSRRRRKSIPLEPGVSPRWMSGLSAEQTDQVRGILDAVGFDGYAMDDPNPRTSDLPGLAASRAGLTR
jgi:hypothetical protein